MAKIIKDKVTLGLEGIWWDIIYRKDILGNEKVIHTSKKHNTIMVKVTNLIAGLFKNDSNLPSGVTHHAIGRGSSTWDSGVIPPSPPTTDEYLLDEYYRQSIDTNTDVEYIDSGGNPFTPTGSPGVDYQVQPRIRIKSTFGYDDANGEWIREQAIFGGDATATIDTGHIFNIIRHPRIRKENNIKIDRYIQFNLNLT